MLHSDGTTKFGEKFGGFQVTTPDSCYSICLSDMKAGGAMDFKDLLRNALSDIHSSCQAVGNMDHSDVTKRVLLSLKKYDV